MGILEKYGRICIESWNKDQMTKEISDAIQNIMQNVKIKTDRVRKHAITI